MCCVLAKGQSNLHVSSNDTGCSCATLASRASVSNVVMSTNPPLTNPTTTVQSHTQKHIAWGRRRLPMQGCVTGEAASLGMRSVGESLTGKDEAAAGDGGCLGGAE